MFELADRLVGIYKTENCTKSVTLNPHLLEETTAPPSQPNLTVIQPSPAKTISRSVLASVQLCLRSDISTQDQLAVQSAAARREQPQHGDGLTGIRPVHKYQSSTVRSSFGIFIS